ncbi:MAG: hypothetical protein SGI88_02500 [Candidatus Hydrogenedentes bacterium]|nr:hypothetical protein [Candidatus Hydrogenedentota bacterium]
MDDIASLTEIEALYDADSKSKCTGSGEKDLAWGAVLEFLPWTIV